jgi:glutamyl-tRNA reductase
MVRIGIVGASYRHATAADVARFSIVKAELAARLPELRAALGGAEVLYLATCNRVEVIFVRPDGPAVDLRPQVFRALLGREPRNGEASAALRAWTGEAAIEHLFLVACGLDSAQAGEQEIYVQLRAAWQTAREAGTTGPLLDRMVNEALGMARDAHRLESHHAPSLADLAAERVAARLASARIPAGQGYVALVGVSPMTRRCGARFAERGVPLLIVNRTVDAAEELARSLVGPAELAGAAGAAGAAGRGGARAIPLESFRRDPPPGCVGLVCATGTSEPVLDRAALERLARGCRGTPAQRPLIIDLGLPPNVDLEVARAVGLERLGMDDLVSAAREERIAHLLRLAPVRAAIDERLGRLRSELAARAIGPQLAQLREEFERIAAAEVDRLLKSELSDLDEAQRARLTEWAGALAHRLAHLPLSGMRAAAEHASSEATEAFFREARLKRRIDQ